MEFDENSKNCHLSQEGSEQEFVTILLPIGEEIWRYSENSDGWSDPDYSKNFFELIWSKQGSTMLWNLKIPDLKFRGFFCLPTIIFSYIIDTYPSKKILSDLLLK